MKFVLDTCAEAWTPPHSEAAEDHEHQQLTELVTTTAYEQARRLERTPVRAADIEKRRLRRTLQRDEARLARLLEVATGQRLPE